METSDLNNSVLNNFGEAMTINVGAVDTSVTAVFRSSYVSGAVVDMSYQQAAQAVTLLTSVWAATSAAPRDTITRDSDSVVYTIISAESDDGGMTVLELSKNA